MSNWKRNLATLIVLALPLSVLGFLVYELGFWFLWLVLGLVTWVVAFLYMSLTTIDEGDGV